jgi:hypothetical protein
MGRQTLKAFLVAAVFALIFSCTTVFAADAQVPVDIKPGSCTNPVNIKSNGVLPICILGGDPGVGGLDVATIDLKQPVTLKATVKGQEYSLGIAPFKKPVIDDVTSPPTEETCDEEIPDGFKDLLVRFKVKALVQDLTDQGAVLTNGEVVILTIGASLIDETTIEGSDSIVIKKPGKK